MTKQEFCSRLDHSILGWTCTEEQVKQFCQETLDYGFASVCVNPDYVKFCSEILEGKAGVSCVCGFPCGANTIQTKIFEGLNAIDNGATELDCVTNYGLLRSGKDAQLLEEYKAFVAAVKDKKPDVVVKYIIYAPYTANPTHLTEDETKRVADMVVASGADYIKFFCDPRLIKPIVGASIKMKFSGTINFDVAYDAAVFGCERLGEDSAVQWLKETPESFWTPDNTILRV